MEYSRVQPASTYLSTGWQYRPATLQYLTQNPDEYVTALSPQNIGSLGRLTPIVLQYAAVVPCMCTVVLLVMHQASIASTNSPPFVQL